MKGEVKLIYSPQLRYPDGRRVLRWRTWLCFGETRLGRIEKNRRCFTSRGYLRFFDIPLCIDFVIRKLLMSIIDVNFE